MCSRGFTLVETAVVLAVVAVATASVASALGRVAAGARLLGARNVVATALGDARRGAYLTAAPVAVAVGAGATTVVIDDGRAARSAELPAGTSVASAPRRGGVTFRGGGLADNATVVVASGPVRAAVVVNQRGRIR